MGRFRARLARLEEARVPSGACDGTGNTYLVNDEEAADPARVPRCRRCGGQHALVIEEVVVTSRDDLPPGYLAGGRS
jgi:hypothetical protein